MKTLENFKKVFKARVTPLFTKDIKATASLFLKAPQYKSYGEDELTDEEDILLALSNANPYTMEYMLRHLGAGDHRLNMWHDYMMDMGLLPHAATNGPL